MKKQTMMKKKKNKKKQKNEESEEEVMVVNPPSNPNVEPQTDVSNREGNEDFSGSIDSTRKVASATSTTSAPHVTNDGITLVSPDKAISKANKVISSFCASGQPSTGGLVQQPFQRRIVQHQARNLYLYQKKDIIVEPHNQNNHNERKN